MFMLVWLVKSILWLWLCAFILFIFSSFTFSSTHIHIHSKSCTHSIKIKKHLMKKKNQKQAFAMNKNMATFRMNSKCEFNQPRKTHKKHSHTHPHTHPHTHTHIFTYSQLIKLVAGIVSSANTQMGKQKVAKKGKSSERNSGDKEIEN